MRKHLKSGIIALVVAALAVTVFFSVSAFASSTDGEADEDGGPRQVFTSKVAGALGLDEEQVADAFAQARQEMMDEAWEQRLAQAVEDGLITEEEAAEIQDWWDSRPEALENLGQFQLRNAWHNHLCPDPSWSP